jgi:hypothetical protein
LQPNMGATVRRTNGAVAYFEGIPEEPGPVAPGAKVTLDAHGSYAFSNAKKMRRVPAKKLRYKWTFGDGSPKASGATVQRTFRKTTLVTLTVRAGRSKAGGTWPAFNPFTLNTSRPRTRSFA